MWEKIVDHYGRTERLKVPGGWLVRVFLSGGDSVAITFFPDPKHEWKPDNK